MVIAVKHPATSISVANWFLERSWRKPLESAVPPCDQMKLQKLVYLAHAWYLGNGCGELFQEDVQAWPFGPVIPDLYDQFKNFGRREVTKLARRLEGNLEDGFDFVTPRHDGSLDVFFERVWDAYKEMTGIQLSNMTHRVGEPWTILAEKYGYELDSKPTIPSELIEAVYARRIEEAENGQKT